MPATELCSEADIVAFVDAFYRKVQQDPRLGPIFHAHVHDWNAHLPKMVDFWSAALRKTARYRGTPMPAHVAVPGLTGDMFAHWLQLFRSTTAAQPNVALRQRADDLAERIAQRLWYGYQLHRAPDRLPEAIGTTDAR